MRPTVDGSIQFFKTYRKAISALYSVSVGILNFNKLKQLSSDELPQLITKLKSYDEVILQSDTKIEKHHFKENAKFIRLLLDGGIVVRDKILISDTLNPSVLSIENYFKHQDKYSDTRRIYEKCSIPSKTITKSFQL